MEQEKKDIMLDKNGVIGAEWVEHVNAKFKAEYDNRNQSQVEHPNHYGGDTTYEAIKVIENWSLGFCLGNTIKYISRAGKKDKAKELEDLQKASWYLNRHIEKLKA